MFVRRFPKVMPWNKALRSRRAHDEEATTPGQYHVSFDAMPFLVRVGLQRAVENNHHDAAWRLEPQV